MEALCEKNKKNSQINNFLSPLVILQACLVPYNTQQNTAAAVSESFTREIKKSFKTSHGLREPSFQNSFFWP